MHLCLFYTRSEEIWEHCQKQIHGLSDLAGWLYISDEHSSQRVGEELGDVTQGEVIDSEAAGFRTSPIHIPRIISELSTTIEKKLKDYQPILFHVKLSPTSPFSLKIRGEYNILPTTVAYHFISSNFTSYRLLVSHTE